MWKLKIMNENCNVHNWIEEYIIQLLYYTLI